jgi:hypothetical protein
MKDVMVVALLACLVVSMVVLSNPSSMSEIKKVTGGEISYKEDVLAKPIDLGNGLWAFPTDDDKTLTKWLGDVLLRNPDLELTTLTAKGGPMASGYLGYFSKKPK